MGENVRRRSHCGKVCRVLRKLKVQCCITQQFHFQVLTKRTESRDSSRYLHTHAHSSAIHNRQHMESTHVSVGKRTDKQDVVRPTMKYHSASERKETLAHATTWVNPEDITLRLPVTKDKHCYDST